MTTGRALRLDLPPATIERMDRIKDRIEASSNAEVVRRALEVFEASLAGAEQASPLVPVRSPFVAASAADAVIPHDEMHRRRERGLVAAFIRLDGREWKGTGPNPLEPGCTISADVLAEFAGKLDITRQVMARQAAEDAAFGRMAG